MNMETNQDSQKKKIINTCHTCRNPIYEGEPIYGSSRGSSSGHASGGYAGRNQMGGYSGYYSGTHGSETWAQCSWCYDQWQAEVARSKSFWMWWWLGGLVFVVIATTVSIVMIPGVEQNGNQQEKISWYKIKLFSVSSWKIPLIAPIVLFTSLALVSMLGKLFQPNVDRYKLRKRPRKL